MACLNKRIGSGERKRHDQWKICLCRAHSNADGINNKKRSRKEGATLIEPNA